MVAVSATVSLHMSGQLIVVDHISVVTNWGGRRRLLLTDVTAFGVSAVVV